MAYAKIPSASEIRDLLQQLGHAKVRQLAEASEVPFTTLWKVRTGETPNPRLETVRQFFPLLIKATSRMDVRKRAPEEAAEV